MTRQRVVEVLLGAGQAPEGRQRITAVACRQSCVDGSPGRDQCGAGQLVVSAEPLRVRNVGRDRGQRRVDASSSLGQLDSCLAHERQLCIGLTDRLLGRPTRCDRRSPVILLDVLLSGDHEGLCRREQLPRLVDVAGHRAQRLRRVLGRQSGKLLLGHRQAPAYLFDANLQLGQELGDRRLQIPQLGELRLLRVEAMISRRGEGDNAFEVVAKLWFAELTHRLRVLELALQAECLGRACPSLVQRGLEAARCLDTELCLGKRQLLRRRPDGVVDVDECGHGSVAELFRRHRGRCGRTPGTGVASAGVPRPAALVLARRRGPAHDADQH